MPAGRHNSFGDGSRPLHDVGRAAVSECRVTVPHPALLLGRQGPGPFLSPPVRVRRTRGWPLVPTVRRLGSKAQYVGSLAEEETEHDATAALITLVATHMLNVHPVMLATATAAVAQWRSQRETERVRWGEEEEEEEEMPWMRPTHRGVQLDCGSRACDADQARLLGSLFR